MLIPETNHWVFANTVIIPYSKINTSRTFLGARLFDKDSAREYF